MNPLLTGIGIVISPVLLAVAFWVIRDSREFRRERRRARRWARDRGRRLAAVPTTTSNSSYSEGQAH